MTHIRPAAPSDIAPLVVLINALAAHHGDPAGCTPAALTRDLFTNPVTRILVAIAAQDTLVGYTALTDTVQLQFGVRGMDMHHLFVARPHRGQGIGARLVSAGLTMAREQGCAYVTVGTHPENHTAQTFYTHLGFAPRSGTAPRFSIRL